MRRLLMAVDQAIVETIEYRVALVDLDSRKLLALDGVGGYRLPRVSILAGTRPAAQLQKAIKDTWGLTVLVLDFVAAENGLSRCAVAEILTREATSELCQVTLDKLLARELCEQEHAQLASLLFDNTDTSISRIGWIDQAIRWVESETSKKLSSKSQIEQFNAGGAFSLIRFHMDDEKNYWLKATGAPNLHELSITRRLSALAGDCLPQLIAARPAWNAWLMSGGSRGLDQVTTDPNKLFRFVEDAVDSMAKLQMRTHGHGQDLLDAGASNQTLEVFQRHSKAMFDYLTEAMGWQTSTKVPALTRSRLEEIRSVFEDVCRRMEDLQLPTTIVHGDLNCGNILVGHGSCQFIDWCEARVGISLISLQHLLLINRMARPDLKDLNDRLLTDRYRKVLLGLCDAKSLDQGFVCMPLLAIASALYGRGDWLTSERRNDQHRMSQARSLARYMDRAAREPELLELLCH
jgi:hypothetical protein